MELALIAITEYGKRLGEYLLRHMKAHLFIPHKLWTSGSPHIVPYGGKLNALISDIWNKYRAFIFIMPAGIVIRTIKDHIKDKYTDPAVVVVDEMGRYAVSLLSGHEGGANKLAQRVALLCEGDFVVTTGSEAIKKLVVGMGCQRETHPDILKEALMKALTKVNRTIEDVRLIVTVEDKKDEEGLYRLAERLNVPLKFISKELIKAVEDNFPKSEVVKKAIGIYGVAEPCAVLGGQRCRIILPKIKWKGVTVAIGEERSLW